MIKLSTYRFAALHYTAWWLFWIVAQTVVLHRLNIAWPLAWTDAALFNFLLALAGYIIINTYRFYSAGSKNYVYRLGYIFILTLLSVMAFQWITTYFYSDQQYYTNFVTVSMPVRYLFSLLMISCMALISGLRFYVNDQEENKKRKDEAELLHRDAELSKVRQQLQPHFLFNSLNSISALAGSQPEQARKMIQQLSDFLRGTLKKDEQQLVPLSEELQHLKLYLDIEKVRFGYRLNTDIRTDEMSLKMRLPSLLLQPIVENAIKFGLYDTTENITVRINAKQSGTDLSVQVENPFDPTTSIPKQGTGFGLNAVQKRLSLLYSRNDLLSTEQKDSIFITSLIIPQNL